MIEYPNPCLTCCSVMNYADLSGLLGQVETKINLETQYFLVISTNTCYIFIQFARIRGKLPENSMDIPTLSSFKFTF